MTAAEPASWLVPVAGRAVLYLGGFGLTGGRGSAGSAEPGFSAQTSSAATNPPEVCGRALAFSVTKGVRGQEEIMSCCVSSAACWS